MKGLVLDFSNYAGLFSYIVLSNVFWNEIFQTIAETYCLKYRLPSSILKYDSNMFVLPELKHVTTILKPFCSIAMHYGSIMCLWIIIDSLGTCLP
jgi:hypothetical protein